MPFNTRFREGSIPSKLDLLFTNVEEMIEDVKSIPALGRSDHIGVTFRIVVSTSMIDNVFTLQAIYKHMKQID